MAESQSAAGGDDRRMRRRHVWRVPMSTRDGRGQVTEMKARVPVDDKWSVFANAERCP